MKCIDASDKKFNEMLNGSINEDEVMKNDMVIFKKDVEEFIGPDGEMMGGFNKGQIANLPHQIAQILIEDEKAEQVQECY